MSDPVKSAENFLQRWSWRKRMAETRRRGGTEPPNSTNAETELSNDTPAQGRPDLPAFDPATLPPIDSITAASDIRAYLAAGVPEELSRAALRRAWTTDPAIRDFIGLAENQWDFTKPDGVPGFGSLEATAELRRLVARLFGEPADEPPPGAEPVKQIADTSTALPAPRPAAAAKDAVPERPTPQLMLRPDNVDAATQTERGEAVTPATSPDRRHGGAMPK